MTGNNYSITPQGPTDDELFAIAEAYAEDNGLIGLHNAPDFARAVLARTTRRPKPPSLKEQALEALDDAVMRGDCITVSDALPAIRRALESLPY